MENWAVMLILASDLVLLTCLQLYLLFYLMEHFKVGTLNVNGAREAKKRAMIYERNQEDMPSLLPHGNTHTHTCR